MVINEHSRLLVLDFDLEAKNHTLKISPNSGTTFSDWSAHTRVSPVWECTPNTSSNEKFIGFEDEDVGIAFIASVNPSAFIANFGVDAVDGEDGEDFKTVWLSLGSYNLIVVLKSQNAAAMLEEYCESVGAEMELWTFQEYLPKISTHVIGEMTFYSRKNSTSAGIANKFVAEIDATEDHFRSPLIELTALLSMASKRASSQIPTMEPDFKSVSEIAYRFLTDPAALRAGSDQSEIEKSRVLAGLHNINAGLSRLSSQAFSGATPISKTECHFWPHSLLGIGTANRALRNIVAFISDAFEDYGFSARTSQLLVGDYAFEKSSSHLPFSTLNERFLLDEIEAIEPTESFIPITYFSGRDGFKNSHFTTSAPLMSIQAGNSYQYSLVTITHEVSHRIVSSTLSKVVSLMENNLPVMVTVLENMTANPRQNADFFADNFVITLNAIAEEYGGLYDSFEDTDNDPEFIRALIRDFGEEFEEHLVHIFDFWYFFDRNVVLYITTIWCSWAVIPDIVARVDEYVVRTLIALSSNNISGGDWLEESREEMRSVFRELSDHGSLHLADNVLELLDDEERFDLIRTKIRSRQGIIRIFHAFFKSKNLARTLIDEPLPTSRGGGSRRAGNLTRPDKNYSFDTDELTLFKFGNPIRFLNQFGADETANSTKSAWVLYMLAFNLFRRKEDG